MKNEHTLTASQRQHIADVQAKIRDVEGENLKFEGSIRRNEREVSMMQRHLRLYLGQLADENGIPMGARLSADGARLLAPAADAAPNEPAPPAAAEQQTAEE